MGYRQEINSTMTTALTSFFSILEELPVALLPNVMLLRFVFPINIYDYQHLGDNYADLIHWFLSVVIIPASITMVFSVMMTSLCSEYYQFILAQCILGGLA